jgi:dTDP-4-amino-4,6-dideoxygalactose transaminase
MASLDSGSRPIPLVDLRAQYQRIKAQVDEAIDRVLDRSAFIGGEEVESFATEFAAYCAAPEGLSLHCATCGNGTDALYLALRALGIGPGDEVITVAHTFIATAEAISLTGARPVFVDVFDDTLLMAPNRLEEAVTPRTRAVVAVHLYGQPCDMDAILDVARRHDLRVVEDAAQAHGASWRGRRVGTLGDAACFSFYPGKNLGAYGDGGAVVSRDKDLIGQVRRLANHGRLEKYTHEIEGVNSRLDGIQAAVLRVKLRHLDRWNAERQEIAALYLERLRDQEFILPTVHPHAVPVWHLFVVQTSGRERVQAELKRRGVATGVHYPLPLHLQPAYQHLPYREGSFPLTERAAARILSLPIYPEMTEDQVAQVCDALREVCGGTIGQPVG